MWTKIEHHPNSLPPPEELGQVFPAYQPTFVTGSRFINQRHEFISRAVNPATGLLGLTAPGLLDHSKGEPINGWLRIDDALKLYELAYWSQGDILELGTYEGLSTCVLAQAIVDARRPASVMTVDIAYREAAAENLRLCGLTGRVNVVTGDAAASLQRERNRRYQFAFIDHSHRYHDVKEACRLLPHILTAGAYVLFHDYNDPRNGHEIEYGVYQAAVEALKPEAFEFCGVYGCTGLYRYRGE